MRNFIVGVLFASLFCFFGQSTFAADTIPTKGSRAAFEKCKEALAVSDSAEEELNAALALENQSTDAEEISMQRVLTLTLMGKHREMMSAAEEVCRGTVSNAAMDEFARAKQKLLDGMDKLQAEFGK